MSARPPFPAEAGNRALRPSNPASPSSRPGIRSGDKPSPGRPRPAAAVPRLPRRAEHRGPTESRACSPICSTNSPARPMTPPALCLPTTGRRDATRAAAPRRFRPLPSAWRRVPAAVVSAGRSGRGVVHAPCGMSPFRARANATAHRPRTTLLGQGVAHAVRRVRSAGSISTTKGLVIRPLDPAVSVVRVTYLPRLSEDTTILGVSCSLTRQ